MTPEEAKLDAVSELKISIGTAAGRLYMTLLKLGITVELEKEDEVGDALAQAFIDFAKRCEVPHASQVRQMPRRCKLAWDEADTATN